MLTGGKGYQNHDKVGQGRVSEIADFKMTQQMRKKRILDTNLWKKNSHRNNCQPKRRMTMFHFHTKFNSKILLCQKLHKLAHNCLKIRKGYKERKKNGICLPLLIFSLLQKKGQWSCIHQQHKCYEFRVKNLHYAAVMRTSQKTLCTLTLHH